MAKETENNEGKEDDLIAVTEEDLIAGTTGSAADKDTDDDDDDDSGIEGFAGKTERKAGHGDEDDDEDDTNLSDDEKKKIARRRENKVRKQRQKTARERDQREMGLLRKRNGDLEQQISNLAARTEKRLDANDLNSIDAQITQAERNLSMASNVMKKAMDSDNNTDFVRALDYRDNARDDLRRLKSAREDVGYNEEEEGDVDEQPSVSREHISYAQDFADDHPWWDPKARDKDSRRVMHIDRQLTDEGYNPSTREYWTELAQRVKEELPHLSDIDSDDDGKSKNKGKGKSRTKGPQFSTGGRERSLGKNEIFVSKERKQAMEDAGLWDDPVARNKQLKAYAKYDAEAKKGAA